MLSSLEIKSFTFFVSFAGNQFLNDSILQRGRFIDFEEIEHLQ